MGTRGTERTGAASTPGCGGTWPGRASGSPDAQPLPSLLSPALWLLVLGATPILEHSRGPQSGVPTLLGPHSAFPCPSDPSPRFHSNKRRIIPVHPNWASTWPWPQAIFVGGYQRDLEIQLGKPATCSAEVDTRRVPVPLPERGRGGGGDPGRGRISCTGRPQGSHPWVNQGRVPATNVPALVGSLRKKGGQGCRGSVPQPGREGLRACEPLTFAGGPKQEAETAG